MTTTREVWAAREAGQAFKAECRFAEALNALKAVKAQHGKAPTRQYCDTATGAPPLAWQRAYNLAKTFDVGFVYLSAFDAASVEAKRGAPTACGKPSDAEKAIRLAAVGAP